MGLLKTVLARGLSRTVLVGPGKRFIFLYHDVSDPDAPQHSPDYSTRPARFRQQVELIASHFHVVPLDEVVSAEANGGRRLASVTFDDGFLSVRDVALPVLNAKGLPCAVFVNGVAVRENRLANGLGAAAERAYGEKVFLDADDLRRLDRDGVLIGSHTSSHKILSSCDDAELEEEVSGNKRFVEELTGRPVRHLALPYGKREHYDGRVLRFCREAGHEYVYSTNPSFFTPAEVRGAAARPVPRLPLLDETPEQMLFYVNRPLLKRIDI